MSALIVVVGVLVLFAAVLAMAEASISRMTRVRAIALEAEGRRNAALLERLESDPPRYLNAIYLLVMLCQNGSAVLVAIISEYYFDSLGITLVSLAFTLAYFVLVEAMAKTFGILHSDSVALALAPLVYVFGRALSLPTRGLIGIANVLLPGKGLKQGPFVSEEDIRSMAEVGHEEGSIEEHEKELIHSIFTFGDTVVREVMVPRPDVVALEITSSLRTLQDMVLQHGFSRIPVYRSELDRIEGVVYVKDVLKVLHQGSGDTPITQVMRPPHFVPDSKKVAELLREMQRQKFHLAMVTDEYGSVTGLITLEDVLEELVGEIEDEYDTDEPELVPVADGYYRVDGAMPIHDLNELLGTELPSAEWDTVGGLLLGLLGAIPREGQEVSWENIVLRAEKVLRRRIVSVLITTADRERSPDVAPESEKTPA
ncbi:MAG TPA: hemolysin family protein [Candidatus Binatia bacterium]|jgi:CBS domain containing-hemolysin-like protein|nr:hemolysin family protein [Candidatus Binatia bacterium]